MIAQSFKIQTINEILDYRRTLILILKQLILLVYVYTCHSYDDQKLVKVLLVKTDM